LTWIWRKHFRASQQGCQMVSFQTKSTDLGKFCRALDQTTLIYFMSIWNILCPFGIFYSHLDILQPFGVFYGNLVHLVHFFRFWYIVSRKFWQPCFSDERK
jgi:hypothetical protein